MTLKKFLRLSSKRERADVADACRTSVNYLYQLASGHRHASPLLAIRVEAATRRVAEDTGGRLAAVPRESVVTDPEIFDPEAPFLVELAN